MTLVFHISSLFIFNTMQWIKNLCFVQLGGLILEWAHFVSSKFHYRQGSVCPNGWSDHPVIHKRKFNIYRTISVTILWQGMLSTTYRLTVIISYYLPSLWPSFHFVFEQRRLITEPYLSSVSHICFQDIS